jgi:hypothetical protein
MKNSVRKSSPLSIDADVRVVMHPKTIALIAEELRNSNAEPELTNFIKDALKYFDGYDALFSRQAKVAEIESAKQIAGTVATLDRQLRKAPPALTNYLFTPLVARRVHRPKESSAIKRRYERQLRQALRQIRRDCERIVADDAKGAKVTPLKGPEADRAQRFCATLAHRLVETFSERPVTGSAEGPYHRIASLLFELLTGRAEVHLKRHCDFVRKREVP